MKGTSLPRNKNLVKAILCFGLCGLPLGMSPAMAAEKIPSLTTIPTILPAVEREKFARHRQALEIQLSNFKAAAAAFNAKTAADQTDGEYNAVQSQRTAYVKAATAFNKDLAAAMRANPSFSQITQLQNKFETLKQQIDIDRQVIRNFGFERTVDEIEYWGNLPARQVDDAKNAFKAMLFDATLGSVSEAAGAVGSLTPEEVDALNRLADAQGAPSLGIVSGANDVHRALEFLDKTKGAYEAADAIKKKRMLDAAVNLGGLASKNSAFGLLLTADEWAAYQCWQSRTAMKQVRELTKANEGDLILLKSRSEKLKNEVNQLTSVKKKLATLSSEGDSTKLVKKPE